jgi:3-phytase
VADDILARIYVSDELNALYRIGAEPGSGDAKVIVDVPITQGGHFQPDIEGLAIYYKSDGSGYLFASSQGNDSYNVYTREGGNAFLGTFTIDEGIVDKVTNTDGIDVTNIALGSGFPMGLFVAQDGNNQENGVRVNQNFKLVPYESIGSALNLTVDTTWDPRLVGAPVTGSMISIPNITSQPK